MAALPGYLRFTSWQVCNINHPVGGGEPVKAMLSAGTPEGYEHEMVALAYTKNVAGTAYFWVYGWSNYDGTQSGWVKLTDDSTPLGTYSTHVYHAINVLKIGGFSNYITRCTGGTGASFNVYFGFSERSDGDGATRFYHWYKDQNQVDAVQNLSTSATAGVAVPYSYHYYQPRIAVLTPAITSYHVYVYSAQLDQWFYAQNVTTVRADARPDYSSESYHLAQHVTGFQRIQSVCNLFTATKYTNVFFGFGG